MSQTINNRIQALRALFSQDGIQAFIIPSTDPHLSEYVAPHWKSREWISGFTGSAGTVVVTTTKAGLWTDSRYFLQAAQQLEGTEIELYKEMLPETPSISTFLSMQLAPGDTVGIDGKMFSAEAVENMRVKLQKQRIRLKSISDPLDQLWTDRPPMPEGPAFIHETKYAGKSSTEKISIIREELKKCNAKALFLSALDEIAWTLNLRGSDVHCNPVVVSYLLIEEQHTHFFIQPQKITPVVANYLKGIGVSLHPYEEVETYLNRINVDSLLINPAKTNYAMYSAVNPNCRIIHGASPVTLLKAIRNEQEIAGIHAAMQRDGVALVKFLKWLEEAVPTGRETEISVDKKLHNFRAEQDLYKGESFDTIAGYKEHGAIVHYEATPETDVPLKPEGFLLLDSGAQYLDGTTDITRTIALGEPTEQMKKDFTRVLKGTISLAKSKFPAGTRGSQIDILARKALWDSGINYLHGTGHGIGHCLNVHEGPQSIRMEENPVTLKPGMVISDEPAMYRTGEYGIRTENMILVREDSETEFGKFLGFDTLTLCFIDTSLIIIPMLSVREHAWLNKYHQMVYDKISPFLNEEEKAWLKEKTTEI